VVLAADYDYIDLRMRSRPCHSRFRDQMPVDENEEAIDTAVVAAVD
jgi:hypothetical protein